MLEDHSKVKNMMRHQNKTKRLNKHVRPSWRDPYLLLSSCLLDSTVFEAYLPLLIALIPLAQSPDEPLCKSPRNSTSLPVRQDLNRNRQSSLMRPQLREYEDTEGKTIYSTKELTKLQGHDHLSSGLIHPLSTWSSISNPFARQTTKSKESGLAAMARRSSICRNAGVLCSASAEEAYTKKWLKPPPMSWDQTCGDSTVPITG